MAFSQATHIPSHLNRILCYSVKLIAIGNCDFKEAVGAEANLKRWLQFLFWKFKSLNDLKPVVLCSHSGYVLHHKQILQAHLKRNQHKKSLLYRLLAYLFDHLTHFKVKKLEKD